MIGLGLDFDSSRLNQNLIDFFPSHTISSNVKKGGSSKRSNFYPDNNFGFNQKKNFY